MSADRIVFRIFARERRTEYPAGMAAQRLDGLFSERALPLAVRFVADRQLFEIVRKVRSLRRRLQDLDRGSRDFGADAVAGEYGEPERVRLRHGKVLGCGGECGDCKETGRLIELGAIIALLYG